MFQGLLDPETEHWTLFQKKKKKQFKEKYEMPVHEINAISKNPMIEGLWATRLFLKRERTLVPFYLAGKEGS